MFCKNCGKELSNNAIMCPDCGEPVDLTVVKPATKQEPVLTDAAKNLKALSVVGMTLTLIAFVTGIIFGTFFYVYTSAAILLYIIGHSSILPALVGLSIGIYVLAHSKDADKSAKTLSIISVVFAGVVLLFLFLAGCIMGTYYYY